MTRRPPVPTRRTGRAMALLAAAVLGATAASTLGVGAASATPVPDNPARLAAVMTFNIHHGVGVDGRLDLARIAEVIRASGAEVVALQEVDRHFGERSAFADQAAELGKALDMNVAYGANLDLAPPAPGRPRRQYGNAILSRHLITGSRNVLLPRPAGEEQRGLLEATLRVRGLPVRVYSTHLQNTSAASRLLQATAIRATIATSADDPVVLLGDLNARPGAPEVNLLLEVLDDAWDQAGLGPGYTYPVPTPYGRIDYVLHSGDIATRLAAVVPTLASDHFPVAATILLPDTPVPPNDPTPPGSTVPDPPGSTVPSPPGGPRSAGT